MSVPTDSTAVERMCDTLIRFVSKELDLDTDALSADAEYETLDFDSLVLVELAVNLHERFRVPITHEELIEAATVRATAELLVSRGAAHEQA